LGSVGSNTRYNIRRSQKEYQRLGPITVDAAVSAEQTLEYFDRLKTWHQAYWKDKGHSGSFAIAFFEDFHRRLIRERFATGEVQLLRVLAGERVVGYLYNFVYRDRVYNYQSGFDYSVCERYNRPGLVSHHAAIDYNLQQGRRAYDLMAGDSQYKRSLGTQVGELQWIVLQRPQWQFRVEHGLRSIKRWLVRRTAPATLATVPE
jgi:CelD/BcsL family acetyltransferase involved in cellulose biosynthesis